MIDARVLDEFAHRMAKLMPEGLTNLQAEAEKNSRALLEAMFKRLDLVTREEYDVQVAVLARTREKLAALEARVSSLESADDIPEKGDSDN
ncbi:MAG: accessory factor UbiK family protein [Gammaproteobacteria bacterium]|jgi:hypothetical protein|nr:accessory factor UbiK family protein [Gammaproteobacteria bacterium]